LSRLFKSTKRESNNMKVMEAWEKGKKTQNKQNEIIDIFITKIRNVVDMESLEVIKKELLRGAN
jgi:hypothetical protein